ASQTPSLPFAGIRQADDLLCNTDCRFPRAIVPSHGWFLFRPQAADTGHQEPVPVEDLIKLPRGPSKPRPPQQKADWLGPPDELHSEDICVGATEERAVSEEEPYVVVQIFRRNRQAFL